MSLPEIQGFSLAQGLCSLQYSLVFQHITQGEDMELLHTRAGIVLSHAAKEALPAHRLPGTQAGALLLPGGCNRVSQGYHQRFQNPWVGTHSFPCALGHALSALDGLFLL